ncbi:MAG: aminotransferase class V-fold PLP-dependent enzyme [Nakamurella sp.]
MIAPTSTRESPVATAPSALRTVDGRRADELFSLDPSLRHLNHSSFGSPPRAATELQERIRAEMFAAPVRWFPAAPELIAAARAELAPFLGLEPDAFAFVPNASAGASVVYNSLDLPAGGEIVVTDHGYGAVVMGAERLARRIGGRVVVAPVDLDADADAAAEAVIGAFTDRTALVVVDQITSPTARGLPVGEICAAARERGIVSAVDAAHAPMLLENAVAAADADYWFGNLHKFACTAPGAAILVPRPGLGDALYPLIDSWGAPLGFPQRFDHQGTLDTTAWLTAAAAIGEIERQFGWARVREHVTLLADHGERVISAAMSEASGVPCRVALGMPTASMRLVALPEGIATTNEEANALRDVVLADLGIEAAFTSFRGCGYLRFSAHVYNTADDYDDFAERAVPHLIRLAARARTALVTTYADTHAATPAAIRSTVIHPGGEQ